MAKVLRAIGALMVTALFVAAVFYSASLWITAELEIEKTDLGQKTLEVFSEYEIPATKASLNLPLMFDRKVDIAVTTSGSLSTDKLGEYIIEYNAEFGDKTDRAEHIVTVVDTTPPKLILSDDEFVADADLRPITEDMITTDFSANDNYDGDITDKVEKKVVGDICYYTVADSSGNKTAAEVKLVYVDKKAPKLSLKGNSTVYMPINSNYKELGFNVSDNYDKDIASKVVVTNNVNMKKNGTYTVKYTAIDAAGNSASVERRVIVYGGDYDGKYDTVKPNGKVIYLTFDDGPSIYTERLLNTLEKYKVKATFFVTNQKPQYQNLISKMAKEGHTVALHTYSHQWDIYSSVDSYMADFNAMNAIIEKQTGSPTRIFRFPGGTSNTVSKAYCKGIMTTLSSYMIENGYTYFDWNVGSNDTYLTNPSDIINTLVNQIKNKKSSVILAHDIKKATVDAMPGFIEHCLKNGYVFKVITDSTEPVRFAPVN